MMRYRGKRVLVLKSRPLIRLPVVLFLCLCFFLAGLFVSLILSQGVNRGGYRHKLLEESLMSDGESGESSLSPIPFKVLSWRPRALYFPKFATAEQCKSIIEMARTKLEPSSLALRKGETSEKTKGIRTSSGTFLSAFEDVTGILAFVERKIAIATMIPRNHGEPFNVLRYEIGQRYASHYDTFNPAEFGPVPIQRVASFLLYLSDVEEGGETMFPYELHRFES